MRSYQQHCAVAKSLDVVGDRWSLLIVRELLAGQERWSEIRDGLPGIAKNLLADRLRDLEAHGVLTHDDGRYALTERGFGLAPVLAALVKWGAAELPDAPADEELRTRWLELLVMTRDDWELIELSEDRAVVRTSDAELQGTPREVVDQLAVLA